VKYFILGIVIIMFSGCSSKSDVEKEIEKIPVDFSIVRFDKEFAKVTPSTLSEIKAKYPAFFPKQFADSVWVSRMNDTIQQELEEEIVKKYPNEDVLEDDLHSLFQHIKFYFPEFKSPKVYTTTSYVDYNNKVFLTDSLLIISLDTYLGADHHFYDNIKKYIAKNLNEDQIAPDVASEYARQLISKPAEHTLLGQIIFYGKELYLKDLWLPEATDGKKIGYTEEELTWAKENETEMWRFFVENELLYSTDRKLPARFINPAPFSRFYLEIDSESPGMIGRYLGWQIVRSYMENNAINVKQLMYKSEKEIFTNSKYKPKK